MDIRDAFPSKYIKASDLKNTQPVVVIDHVAYELVGQSKERKPVIYFQGKDKGLVCNKSNATKIMELLGTPVVEEWVGRSIRLYPTETSFQGDMVECIRVKAAPSPTAPAMATRAPDPEPTDLDESDIPF